MLSAEELAGYEREGLVVPASRLSDEYVERVRTKVESFTAAHPAARSRLPALHHRD